MLLTHSDKNQANITVVLDVEFENVNKLEVTPFMAVMRMIKLEYDETRPELYKMLVTVMQDYNTYGGPQHRRMVRHAHALLIRLIVNSHKTRRGVQHRRMVRHAHALLIRLIVNSHKTRRGLQHDGGTFHFIYSAKLCSMNYNTSGAHHTLMA